MKKIFFLVILLLLPFSSSSLFAALETEITPSIGFPSGTDMKGTPTVGVDVYFCISEGKSPKLKLKSVKQKVGCRVSSCRVERKNDEFKNNKVECTSIKLATSSEFVINEKFSFNIKGLYGLGAYTRNEYTKNKEEYIATSVTTEGEIFVGGMSFLTKKFGIGVDLGYRFSKDINEDKENAEKFDPSGLVTMLNFMYKLSV